MREMKTSTITKKKSTKKKKEAGAQREEALEVRTGFLTVSHRLKVSDKDRT